MRISTSYQFDTYAEQIRLAQQSYVDAQNTVMTGKKINNLSDDPAGIATVMDLGSVKAAATQYMQNLQTGKGVLDFTESALANSNTILTNAYQMAVSAANSTTDQSARSAMASEITDMQQQLLQYANTKGPSNQFVFAGQNNAAAPFTVTTTPGANAVQLASGNYLNFSGDNNDVNIATGPSEVMAINTPGQALFSQAYQALDQLKIDLGGGNISAISGVDIQQIQNSMAQFTAASGVVGTKLQTITTQTNNYTQRVTDLTSSMSDLQDVDMAQAIEKYTLAQTAYQAAMQVASQGFQLNLTSFITVGA